MWVWSAWLSDPSRVKRHCLTRTKNKKKMARGQNITNPHGIGQPTGESNEGARMSACYHTWYQSSELLWMGPNRVRAVSVANKVLRHCPVGSPAQAHTSWVRRADRHHLKKKQKTEKNRRQYKILQTEFPSGNGNDQRTSYKNKKYKWINTHRHK